MFLFFFYFARQPFWLPPQLVWKYTHVCMHVFSWTWILSILGLNLVITVRNVFLFQSKMTSQECCNTMQNLSLPDAMRLSPSDNRSKCLLFHKHIEWLARNVLESYQICPCSMPCGSVLVIIARNAFLFHNQHRMTCQGCFTMSTISNYPSLYPCLIPKCCVSWASVHFSHGSVHLYGYQSNKRK